MASSITNIVEKAEKLEEIFPNIGLKYLVEYRKFNLAKKRAFCEYEGYCCLLDEEGGSISDWIRSFQNEKRFKRVYRSIVNDHLEEAAEKEQLKPSTREMLKQVLEYGKEHNFDVTMIPIVVEDGLYRRFSMILPDDTRIPLKYSI
ncbi:hypothetical protein KY343_01840 [Candidatus Woesearchaeota archaeon]|nr:hypothetical protein [Candidatus Woesearchaeota archaeon]